MFKTFSDYYEFLNTDLTYMEHLFISSNLKPIFEKLLLEQEKNNYELEIWFNDCQIINGVYTPLLSYGENCYPSLNLFKDLSYLKRRAVECENLKYKAKYNHLVYLKTNNRKDAISSISNYFEFLEKNSLDFNNKLEVKGFLNMFENLIFLSKKVKHKQNQVVQLVKELITENKLRGFALFHLMKFISDTMKIDKELKEFFFDTIESEIKIVQESRLKEDYLKFIILIAQKLGKSQTEFQNKLGDFYLEEAKKEIGSFIVHSYYIEAMKAYKKSGNKIKMDKVSSLIQEAKNTISLKKIETSLKNKKIEKYFKSLDKITSELIENYNSNTIYEYLINGDSIFPQAKMLDEYTKSQLQELVTTISFDKNKNISKDNYKGINSYQIYFQNFTLRHLQYVFFKGQSNGKINFESLNAYLENNTWYNLTNKIINPDEKDYSFKWIEFLQKPLKLFFEQSENDIKNNTNSYEGYIIVIDSLTIKFEGILRDFSNRIGAQTIEVEEFKTEERIDFDKLFDNEKFKSTIPKDDIAFFKFLFTRKGINLRNNVAHGFYAPKDYSATIVWLLICAFLKLGNYNFNTQ